MDNFYIRGLLHSFPQATQGTSSSCALVFHLRQGKVAVLSTPPPQVLVCRKFPEFSLLYASDSFNVSSAVIKTSQHGCASSPSYHNTVVIIDGFCSSGVIYIRWLYAFYCNDSFTTAGATRHTGSESFFHIFSLRYNLLPRVCHNV